MRGQKSGIFLIFLSLLMAFGALLWAAPNEESLIQHWEAAQKKDPKNAVFKKLGDKHYRLKTDYFPFDGEIKIHTTINTSGNDEEYEAAEGYTLGLIEVELLNAPKDFFSTYGRSYGMWSGNNNFYYDNTQDKWLTAKEYTTALSARYQQTAKPGRFCLTGWFSRFFSGSLFWILFLFFLVIFVSIASRKQQKYVGTALEQGKKVQEMSRESLDMVRKSLALNEDSNRVLKEILETLRRKE